uniref:Platelet-derived growth factor (PDGF) family profile domain-containing protein n=1 Tax=Mola mola TaxID=94237 RepID=A0A3Q4B6Q7_MOLML
ESVTSVDQLLQLLYPQYNLLQHCLRRKSWRSSSSSSLPSFAISPASTSVQGLWVILEEIQRTSCQPREVCVEVATEHPESTSQIYLPRCVALHRCGGCCNTESSNCTNTSHALVNKTLMKLSPSMLYHIPVMATFVNHTSCECLSKRPRHSIIRRSLCLQIFEKLVLCSPPDLPCASGSLWDPVNCVCISTDDLNYPETGECQCEGQAEGRLCPTGQRWDEELCGCVCAAQCPGNQPLNPDTCQCQCRESPQSCLRQGKRFNPNTCRMEARTPFYSSICIFVFTHDWTSGHRRWYKKRLYTYCDSEKAEFPEIGSILPPSGDIAPLFLTH